MSDPTDGETAKKADDAMEALPMNPEIEPEKSESDSESTGSHDSALNEDENIAEPLQIDSFGPECVDLGVPEAEANIPQTEPICNQSENEAVNTEHAEGSSIPMFKSSISLDIQQSELPSEQNVHKLPEAETDLTKKFEQVLILPDNSNSPQLSPDKAVNEVVKETQLNENVADQNLSASVEQDENAENASCKTVKRKLSKVAASSDRLEEVDSQYPQEDDNCNLSPQKQFKVSCESVTSDVNLNNNNDESPAEDAETNKNPVETNCENLPGKDSEKLNQNDAAKRIESFDKLASSTKLEDLSTGEETGNISGHRRRSIEDLDLKANSSDASPLRKKSHHEIKTEKEPERKIEDSVERKDENVVVNEQQHDQFKQTEENDESDDESDDEEKFDLLKKVRKPKVVLKKNSRKFKFSVSMDIFELGLNKDSIFCGVLLVTDNSESEFYAGKAENLNLENGTLTLCSFVPNVVFEGKKKFCYTYAVSQSDKRNAHKNLPNTLVTSKMEMKNMDKQTQEIIDDSSSIQIFKPCETPLKLHKKVPENKKVFETNRSHGKTNAANNVPVGESISVSSGEGSQLTGTESEKTLLAIVQSAGSDAPVGAKEVYEKNNEKLSGISNNGLSGDSLEDSQTFSRIANGLDTSQEKAKWFFSFCIGKNVFDLNLNKDAELYCGVAIITEKNAHKSYAFYPASKNDIVQKDDKLFQRMNVGILEEEINVNKFFSYCYAVSIVSDKHAHSIQPDFFCISKYSKKVKVKAESEDTRFDDCGVDLEFRQPQPARSVGKSPIQTRSMANEENSAKPDSNEDRMIDDETEASSKLENSEDFANIHPLKQLMKNNSIQNWRESVEKVKSEYLVLNAIFGPDLSVVCHNEPFIIGVASSNSGFQKVVPGYIVADIDGYFWLRFHIAINRNSDLRIEYKYIAVTHLRSEQSKWKWEKLHCEGQINRCVCRFDMDKHTGSFLKYDGLIIFHRNDQKTEFYLKKKKVPTATLR